MVHMWILFLYPGGIAGVFMLRYFLKTFNHKLLLNNYLLSFDRYHMGNIRLYHVTADWCKSTALTVYNIQAPASTICTKFENILSDSSQPTENKN